MNYHTIAGWKRLSANQKDRAVEYLKKQKVIFSCDCVRCWNCKCKDTVKESYYTRAKGINLILQKKIMLYCPNCGMPKISGSGKIYGDRHTRFCGKEIEWMPSPVSMFWAMWEV